METQTEDYVVLIGLDWAEGTHDLAVLLPGEAVPDRLKLSAEPEAVFEWFSSLRARFPSGRIALCFEQSRIGLACSLSALDYVDVYAVNPLQLKAYREAFVSSGAKDDPGDAALMADLLARHRDALRKLVPDDPATRRLGLLCENRRAAVGQRSSLTCELRSVLNLYYPQAVRLAGDSLHSELACSLLMKWPAFQDLATARPQTVRAFLYAHGCRSEERVAKALATVRDGRPTTDDPAVIDPCVLRVRLAVAQIRVLNKAIATYDREIARQFAVHPDATLFASFPGAGTALAPRLLAGFGDRRERYGSAVQISQYSGVAPVVERSGKHLWTHWRWHCPKFLRQTFVEFAAKSVGQSAWARRFYDAMAAKGKGHNAILRALAFKWQRIMFRCWKDRVAYDEQTYLQALARNGSWLAGQAEDMARSAPSRA